MFIACNWEIVEYVHKIHYLFLCQTTNTPKILLINGEKNDTKYAACKQFGLTNDYRATVSYIDLFGFDQSSCSVANFTYFLL